MSNMPRYRIQFVTDPDDPFPPASELASVEAENPAAAVEAMLATGRYPQDPAIRWARVVLSVHSDGSPRFLLRFPVHAEQSNAAIDWELPGSQGAV